MLTSENERNELMTLSKIIQRIKLKLDAAAGPYCALILQIVEFQGTHPDGIWTFLGFRRNLADSRTEDTSL